MFRESKCLLLVINNNLLWFKDLMCAFKIILINIDIKKLTVNAHCSIVCVKIKLNVSTSDIK